MIRNFLELIEVNWWVQSWKRLVLGVMDRSENPKTMEMLTSRVLTKWNREVTTAKWSRIILRSFWATLFQKNTRKKAPQTPWDPKTEFYQVFPGISVGNRFFLNRGWPGWALRELEPEMWRRRRITNRDSASAGARQTRLWLERLDKPLRLTELLANSWSFMELHGIIEAHRISWTAMMI